MAPSAKTATKGKALPATRPPKAGKNPETITDRTALPGSAQAQATSRVEAVRLAQMVNLHIAGFSLAEIGDAIGATEAEVDRMLTRDVGRYVRSQPALRVYVRNFISEKYLGLLEGVYSQATDKTNKDQLEFFDRAARVLSQMQRLHGAEVPAQSEIKVDAAPEMVQTMVEALAKQQGLGYTVDIFDDIEEADVIEAHDLAVEALEASGEAVVEGDEDL